MESFLEFNPTIPDPSLGKYWQAEARESVNSCGTKSTKGGRNN